VELPFGAAEASGSTSQPKRWVRRSFVSSTLHSITVAYDPDDLRAPCIDLAAIVYRAGEAGWDG